MDQLSHRDPPSLTGGPADESTNDTHHSTRNHLTTAGVKNHVNDTVSSTKSKVLREAQANRQKSLGAPAQDTADRNSHHSALNTRDGLNGQDSPEPLARNALRAADLRDSTRGLFSNAHDFIIHQATFINGIHQNEKDSIDLLALNIIPGVQFDSIERDPPPSCYPGTRLDILQDLVSWMRNLTREHSVVWLHGPAGVGKSAIIQTLAESEAHSSTPILGATIFFSRSNERDHPQRVIITIVYQLVVKYQAYRSYVVDLLAHDPLVVKKSLTEQFHWLIAKPFAEKRLLEGSYDTVLITLDGLDDCNGESVQREIIFLVTKFSLQHPTTPLIWIIASRPEPQIRATFSHQNVPGSYLEIDVPVDSDQACADVRLYLRNKFAEIRRNYPTAFTSPVQQWPTGSEFTEVTTCSSGLFAFANTVVHFTEDEEYSNPVAQLQKVLDVLESASSPAAQSTPFAALDILYTLILSGVSSRVLPITRKLLMVGGKFKSLAFSCNILSINQADAYSALRKLHSVFDIPSPEEAHQRKIQPFHSSFTDYLQSRSRSNLFWIDPMEAESVELQAIVRILLEAHNAAQSVINMSSIGISWPRGNREDTRKELFQYTTLRALCGLLGQTPTQYLQKLRRFFQDFDYACLGSLTGCENVHYIISCILKPPLMPHLKEWGITTTVEIQSLNLAAIGLDDKGYIFSDRWPLRKKHVLQSGKMVQVTESDGVMIRVFSSHETEGVFPFTSWAPKINSWYWEVITLRENLDWKAYVDQHLTAITNHLPTHPVTLLGRGNRSCVLITFVVFDQPWVYILPYRPS